jgi:hypothetical protein
VCVHVKIMWLCWDLMTNVCWNWKCMCVFMLKPCNFAGIWWYIMCWNWKCLCVLQRICDSLLGFDDILCVGIENACVFCSKFVIHCRNWVVCSELAFAAKSVSCNEFVIRCRKWVSCSEFVIRCQNWVACSELTFIVKLCVLQLNWGSVPKLYGL